MAIIKSAKKAIRSSTRKRVFNIRKKRAMVDAVKGVSSALGKDRKEQTATLSVAYAAIDKAQKRGIIKKNTAARKKSRLSAQLKKSSTK